VRTAILTAVAMLAFATNSVLALALSDAHIDPLAYTRIRLVSGAVVLAAIAWFPSRKTRRLGLGDMGIPPRRCVASSPCSDFLDRLRHGPRRARRADPLRRRADRVQLTVPAIPATGGVVFIDEPLTRRLLIASAGIVGGVALAMVAAERRRPSCERGNRALARASPGRRVAILPLSTMRGCRASRRKTQRT
jgi:hypothetical protein